MLSLLKPLRTRLGGQLSGGEQQMLTVGRALMGNPSVILLDEPSEGLAPIMVQKIGELIGALRELGTTIVLAEQNRSEEHTSELQSLMRISYAVFCLKKKNKKR